LPPGRYDLNAFPYNLAAWPTEDILKGTRKFIPPVAGVDITPIVWVAIISFFSEILLGPQGLLTIVQRKGGF
jgi:YggT family protein